MKNRVHFDVINLSATSMRSIIQRSLYITVFKCAHEVRKYAYYAGATPNGFPPDLVNFKLT